MKALVMMMTLLVASAYGFEVMERAEALIDQARSNVNAVGIANPTRIFKDFSVCQRRFNFPQLCRLNFPHFAEGGGLDAG